MNLLSYIFVSFWTAFLPTRMKTKGEWARRAHKSGDILNALVELGLGLYWAVALFLHVSVAVGASIIEGGGDVSPSSSFVIDNYSMLLIVLASYLIRPDAWLSWLTALSGFARCLDAAANNTHRGPWIVDLVDYLVRKRRGARDDRDQAELLGPERPDEIVSPQDSPDGCLELYAWKEQPFSDLQAVSYGGDLFTLCSKEMVKRGRYTSLCYRFRLLPASEVARGKVFPLG